ncbi:MAG: pyridoxal 5'-phosphate synthase glutaminase subunit PdxT [Anaerolineae bacterium]|nr:pyridoxal 5'-phosphate synthase glutaminase subunit PdxT [Anaerolineae bacterium]
MTTIGVLAVQGDFAEHRSVLQGLGVNVVEVRKPEHLDGLDGLIIPGGESTAISRVARAGGLLEPLRQFVRETPTWGTCAGAIMLAKEIEGETPHLAAMDIRVVRNAFGAQIDSFTADLDVAGLEGGPLHAVFIRAPIIASAGPGVDVLARLDDGRIVAVRQGRLLATSFHPELTPDPRLHAYFADMARQAR